MRKRIEFLQMFRKLLAYAEEQGIVVICFSFYRTPEQQNLRYQDGKSDCDGYKIISKHQLWRAVDLAIVEGGDCVWCRTLDYVKLGQFWKNLGGVWGGDFSKLDDVFHYEA